MRAHEPAPVSIAYVKAHAPVEISAEAAVLFASVNAERLRHGLSQLVPDVGLERLAFEKARDMAVLGYFGHTDLEGVTFEERVRSSGIAFRYAAENLAFDHDVQHAHAALMHSAEHRANVLDPQQKRLGTAVITVGDGETFYVEEFAG
ncbi:MAG TPA: CAP domain-containing protein [Candidatus Acidoferrum sp.]|nr:CAP domain-containing protein [Candidatus Acidoferrum sp.]